jgi:hypothetical protein
VCNAGNSQGGEGDEFEFHDVLAPRGSDCYIVLRRVSNFAT